MHATLPLLETTDFPEIKRGQLETLQVTGLDPDLTMIEFSQTKESQVKYIEGDVLDLPFTDNSFDYCSAITSLCFVTEPEKAISEMLRVSRHGVILGLLNRHSLLHKQKKHSVSYQGARWDTVSEIKQWRRNINPDMKIVIKSAVLIPSAGIIARTLEMLLPDYFPYASFLAVGISNSKSN